MACSRATPYFLLCLASLLIADPTRAWRSAGKRRRQEADTVQELISSLHFFNNGTVYSNETYAVVPITSIYNEGYSYLGEGEDRWTLSGHVSYLFRVETTTSQGPMNNTDLQGDDLTRNETISSWQDCQALCDSEAPRCKAWTFDSRPPSSDTHGCWLKSDVPRPSPKDMDISGCAKGVISPNCEKFVKMSTPPSGMRSAVPLGGIGGGSIELRGDGRLADWQICNNGPEAPDGRKVDIDEAAFGVWVRTSHTPSAVLLRTHPSPSNASLPAVESLRYRGAFPAARLIAEDKRLEVDVSLTAFSSFERFSSNDSLTPAISFHFNVSNPTDSDAQASVFFNLPSSISNGSFQTFQGKSIEMTGLTLQRDDEKPLRTTGNLTMAVLHQTDQQRVLHVGSRVGASLEENWRSFVDNNGSFPDDISSTMDDDNIKHGSLSARIDIPSKSSGQLVILLTWFYPHHYWADVDIGNYYENFFSSSEDVAEQTAGKLVPILQAVKKWNEEMSFTHNQPIFKKAFSSDFLDDSLVNSAGTTLKTTMYLRDGRWRQFESHSCAQMEPPHIHGYRSLFYSVVFPDLERQTVELYADTMLDDGTVSESFGGGCFGASRSYNLDKPDGGKRGDDNAVFILDVFQNWLFHKDGDEFLEQVWPKLLLATRWQLQHADQYGLTANLVNTFDEHGMIGNVNSYNAFMYLASISATQYLANFTKMKNESLVDELQKAKERGVEALNKMLWTGSFYRSFWCENGLFSPEALQSDVLYGTLWSKVLNFDIGVPDEHLVSHLLEERKRNLTPFGMRFCSNMTVPNYHCSKNTKRERETKAGRVADHHHRRLGVGFTDQDTWEAHTLNSGTLSIFTKAVSDEEALGLSALTLDKYRLTLNDYWDFRDLSSCYDDAPGQIRPVCNSHYSRQMIVWALLFALNGQEYDPLTKTISLDPRPIVSEQWPVMLSFGSGLMRPAKISPDQTTANKLQPHLESAHECYELQVYSGSLHFKKILLRGKTLAENVALTSGDIETFCY